uniref:TSA: Wollemia nobilis Ref_Wollemi_Transcript_1917_1343 transcribed RNA sequence n=1 Tax=Wollemia nobilis TaxID=56998 RepID=A0A0C9RYX9_9CONI
MAKQDEINGASNFLEAEKQEAMKKYMRSRRAKKYIAFLATATAVSSIILWLPVLVETVKPPLRLLCLVVIPQLWVLCGNPRFLFIVSNIIIITLAAQSGMISSTPSTHGTDFYAEFIRRSESIPKYSMIDFDALCNDTRGSEKARPPPRDARPRKSRHADSTVTATSAKNQDNSSSLIVVGNETAMSDDELNKRAEEFIANFNRQLRLQRERSVSPAGR